MRSIRGITAVAALVGFALMGTALPAGADPEDDAAYMSSAAVDVAQYNQAAIAAEATAGTADDNISCTIGAWTGANTPRVVIPNINTTHGQDVGSADGDCADLDPVDPPTFTSYLEVNFEYKDPATGVWVEYDSGDCTQPSAFGHAIFAQCTRVHQFPNPADPIQDYARRVVFNLGVMIDEDTKGPVRSTRAIGPLPPSCGRLLQDAGAGNAKCREMGW